MKQHNKEIEQYRVEIGEMGSDSSYGNNGLFKIPIPAYSIIEDKEKNENSIIKSDEHTTYLNIICSDFGGWDHVSVTIQNERRNPTWEEMLYIKNLFWTQEETVVQFHPAMSEYKNCHPYCLHLWKKAGHKYELPPNNMV